MNDPGLAAARARVADVLDQATRIPLQVVVVAPPDAERRAARDRARDAAVFAGRDSLLEEAVTAAKDQTMRSFARSGFSGTWAFTDMAASVARADDRVAAAAALEEAVTAAVVEDLVDPETLEVLRSTSDQLGDLKEIPAPGSIAGFGAPATWVRGPVQVVIAGAIALFLAVLGLVGASIITFALGLAIAAGLARRRDRRDV
jgi:hypothetical protein